MNIRLLALCFVHFSLVSFACSGGDDGGPVCEPGAQEIEACEIEPLIECTRTCLDDGSAWGACEGCPEVHPCEGVDCGGFGTCEIFDGEAICNCESGYLPDGLDCKLKDCTPDCDGKDCGSDGCDGTCGTCDLAQDCVEGICTCTPQCDGKACGDDSCSGSCGECAAGDACQAGACVPCEADCWGKQCGDDGCGGSCGDCGGEACQDGICVCAPECDGKVCGDDGCGGSCGICSQGEICDEGVCVACVPDCAGKVCGDDGCGGTCGQCPQGMNCAGGQCVSQGSSCVGFCGLMAPDYCYCDDACFGSGDCCPDVCDFCPTFLQCDCEPSCEGKECGSDGCSGSCGDCAEGLFCVGCQCSTEAMTCGDFYACIISCDEDYNCQDACLAAAPEEAMAQFEAIEICLGAAGYFDCFPDDQDCIDTAMAQCQAELDACFQPNLDCPGITACMSDCPEGESGCTALCYFKGLPAAQDMYEAMIDCILAVCGDEPTDECWEQAIAGDCQAESAACGLEPCEPDCTDKECGDDGCDGICGECPEDENQVCSDLFECVCAFEECGDVCCADGEVCVDGVCTLP